MTIMWSWFGKQKKQAKKNSGLSIREQLLGLKLGSYIQFSLSPTICDQLKERSSSRFDLNVLNSRTVNGLVKAVYTSETTGLIYVELLGVVIVSGTTATRREYVVMEPEITAVAVISCLGP